MIKPWIKWTVAAAPVLALAIFGAWLSADEHPAGGAGEHPAGATEALGVTLTPESLKSFLQDMHYKVKEQPTSDLGPIYDITVTVAGESWPVSINVSAKNPNLIYVTLAAGGEIDPAQVSPAALLELLAANDKYTPTHFSYDPNLKRFFLYRVFPNLDITKEQMLLEFGNIATVASRTRDLWDSTRWNKGS